MSTVGVLPGGLHAAMRAGRLDAYRSGVVADELEHAPAEARAKALTDLVAGTSRSRRCSR